MRRATAGGGAMACTAVAGVTTSNFQYTVDGGKHKGLVLEMGLDRPREDFPMTPPTGPHINKLLAFESECTAAAFRQAGIHSSTLITAN